MIEKQRIVESKQKTEIEREGGRERGGVGGEGEGN